MLASRYFGRYAKDIVENQTYPEVRPAPSLPPQPPYDVTAWSLGLQMGVRSTMVDEPFDASLELLDSIGVSGGGVEGRGDTYLVDAAFNDAFRLVNQLLAGGGRVRRAVVAFHASSRRFPAGSWVIENASRGRMRVLP